ncbi:baseplate J/gp47 family protein [Geminocystis sp. NIES-3709]|uniref:baseplate J/gp47 family protein n=1 Tax=Geminocystis sp. NIES-3709 TaxID=1617448 RepID=UPI0005FC687B|nr:baseplate J/gp47 family protein [Geminocystis sp. NIES-3709]BAQ65538.1 phage-related baseplate assembly protein [Geminocystis sp. NIES-3709]
MTNFPRPIFAVPDALSAETELKAKYTELTGKELFPAQPESLLTNWAAYLKTVTDSLIQYTGEQCLVNFANGVNLDRLGDFWETPRLEPQSAIVTLEFSLGGARFVDTIVPEGTRVRTQDRLFLFATTENLVIPTGQVSGTVQAECTVTGEEANGYAIGQISEFFDLVSDIESVTNTSISNSGSGVESDDRYRKRLLIAPNKLNTAGSRDAYKFWVLSSDPSISDVGVASPSDIVRLEREEELALELGELLRTNLEPFGVDIDLFTAENIAPFFRQYIKLPRFFVDVYLLTNTGLPSEELIEKVQTFLDDEEIRPLTDTVKVLSAIEVEQNLAIGITININANSGELTTQLNTLLEEYVEFVQSRLGIDIVPSQIISRLQVPGVYQVEVYEPEEAIKINFNERALITDFDINIVGVSEE